MALGRLVATTALVTLTVAASSAVAFASSAQTPPRQVHWRTIQPPAWTQGGSVIPSCASTTFCVGADGLGNVSYYDGRHWSAAHKIDSTGFSGLSCPTSQFCAAVDTGGRTLVYRHGTWTQPQAVFPDQGTPTMSCGAADFCVTLSNGDYSYFDGSAWTAPAPATAGSSGLDAAVVSCTGYRCEGSTFANGAGPDQLYTFDGSGWSVLGGAPGGVVLMSCWQQDQCATAGRDTTISFLDGTTVTRSGQMQAAGAPESLDCVSRNFCLYLWQRYIPSLDDYVGRLSVFDGSSWQTVRGWSSGPLYADISCAATDFCMIGDVSTVRTYDGELGKRTSVSPYPYIASASCATRKFCIGTDGQGNASIMRGRQFRAPLALAEKDRYQSSYVSCAPQQFCAFAAGKAVRFYAGGAWHSNRTVDSATLTGVACGSSSLCSAVDSRGRVVTWNGTRWSSPHRLVGKSGSIVSIACGGTKTCIASDSAGGVFAYRSGRWSTRHVEFSAPISSDDSVASCGGNDLCFVASAQVGRYNGHRWSSAHYLKDADGNRASVGYVRCTAPTACLALDGSQYPRAAFVFEGAKWTHAQAVQTGRLLDCVDPSTCLVMS